MSTTATTTGISAGSQSASAKRMRLHRARRRRGARCVDILVRESDIEALVRRQLLDPAHRNEGEAIRQAIQDLLFTLVYDM
jgi:hypothetical protein